MNYHLCRYPLSATHRHGRPSTSLRLVAMKNVDGVKPRHEGMDRSQRELILGLRLIANLQVAGRRPPQSA
jgi:hypothetical protein